MGEEHRRCIYRWWVSVKEDVCIGGLDKLCGKVCVPGDLGGRPFRVGTALDHGPPNS